MTALVLLAILAQAADATVSCHGLAHGGREANPVLPQSCPGIIAIKAGAMVPLLLLEGRPRRIFAGIMVAGGAAGVTLTVLLTRSAR